MTNLLREVLDGLAEERRTPDDITYIGSRDGHSCTWEQFRTLADVNYDSGYGGQEVVADLEIHFKDGSWWERAEYDGSEWWVTQRPFTVPPESARKPINTLIGKYWRSLSTAGEDDD